MPTSMVPPASPRLIPRLELSVKVFTVASVPPLMVSDPGVAEPGAVPRLLSDWMLMVPSVDGGRAAVGVGAGRE